MSFLDKFKATATKVGTQATAFGHTVAREAQTGSQKALTNFKLENEVRAIVTPPRECGLTRLCLLPHERVDSTTCAPHLSSVKSRPRSSPASSQTRNIPRAPSTPSRRKSSAAQRRQSQFACGSHPPFAAHASEPKSSRATCQIDHRARSTTGVTVRRPTREWRGKRDRTTWTCYFLPCSVLSDSLSHPNSRRIFYDTPC